MREPPEVEFHFGGKEPSPEEKAEMLAKRDALLRAMGRRPPDEEHEFWWSPDEEKQKSK